MHIERRDERVGEVEQAAHTNPARSFEMNYRFGRAANAAGKKERLSSAALALAVGLALACLGSAALAINDPIPGVDIVVKPGGGINAPRPVGSDLPTSNKPIPGIDIVVKKNPDGNPIVVPIDDSGKFSLRLKEPGNHTISTACRQSSGCMPHKLSGVLKPGADGEPSIIAILIGLLLPAQKAGADGTSYTFTVGDRGVVLSGQIPSAAGVRVAAGDVDGDGVETRKAAPKKAAGKTPHKIVEILGNQSPEEIKVGDPLPPYGQPVIFTASKAAPRPDGGDGKLPGLAGDPIPVADVRGGDAEKPRLATPGTPIIGIPIGLEGDPGSIKVSTTTDEHGAYHFDNLPAGNYKMTIAGLPDQSIRVGASGPINGEVMRASNGAIYLTALKSSKGGHIDVIAWSWGLANKGAVQLPGPTRGRVINNSETDAATVEAINGIGGTGGGRLTAGGAIDGVNVDSSNRDHIDQDAQTDVRKKTAVQTGSPEDARIRVSADVSTLRVQNYGIRATETAPGTDGEDAKLPGVLRVINNSETETATINPPVNGIGGTGGGRLMAGGAIDGGDGKPPGLAGDPIVITDNLGNTHVLGRAATSPKGGNSKLPGLADQPIAGLDVKLGKLGGGIMATLNSSGSTVAAETMVSSKTDSQGNFRFDKLPAGNYELTLPGLPAQLLTVGADGIAGGTVMRGPDGNMTIFDRWGNRTATAPKGGGSKTAEKPVGFGSGNTMGTGLGGIGPGGGMTPPGAGPAMGGAGPAIGGPGSAMGGPGSAMKNR